MSGMTFSVLMSVYRNDSPEFFRQAVESVTVRQSLPPSELVLVVDGPVPASLEREIRKSVKDIPYIRPVWLEKNGGLGNALRVGMENTSHEIVARMDSDDIAVPDRFERQLRFLEENPNCSMVGGQIEEFIGQQNNVVGRRIVPESNAEIHNWIKSRCPFNHMTVMMRREKVLAVGNYQDWHFNEDYWLWIRMAEAGCRFANLPGTLVNVRVGEEMYARRGGWKYFKSEKGLQDYMLRRKMIALPRYLFNVAVRFGVQVAMPNSLRGFIFRKLFRK